MNIFVSLLLLFVNLSSSASTFEELILSKETAIKNFAIKIEESFENRCSIMDEFCLCSLDACRSYFVSEEFCNLNVNLVDCNCSGMMMVNQSVVSYPEESRFDGSDEEIKELKESICYTQQLDPDFRTHEQQGFGTWNGIFRIYPGRVLKTCGSYDPRVSSWYVAATRPSRPKDVVVLLDKSGSMSSTWAATYVPDTWMTLWDFAREAIYALLKTFTIADHINIVLFSDLGQTSVITADKTRLIQGTKANRDHLKELLESATAYGMTNFEEGFRVTFDLIRSSRNAEVTSDCETAILFITEGKGEDNTTEIYEYVSNQNQDVNAVLFTYSLGDKADKVVLKQLACNQGGIWQDVPDARNLLSQMLMNDEYFSLGYSQNTTARTVWVEPYHFSTDGRLVTVVSTPVYSYLTDPPMLLGVAGIGLSMDELQKIEGYNDKIFEELTNISMVCPTFHIIPEMLEALRCRYSIVSSCYNDCSSMQDIVPCDGLVYPDESELWCNTAGTLSNWTNGTSKSYEKKAYCCECDTDDSENDTNAADTNDSYDGTLILGTETWIAIIIPIVCILFCLVGLFFGLFCVFFLLFLKQPKKNGVEILLEDKEIEKSENVKDEIEKSEDKSDSSSSNDSSDHSDKEKSVK